MKRQATQVRTPQPCHATPRQRREQIVRLCAVIAREFQPDKIILFGSWAYGTPDADSDIDLLVVMPFEGSPFREEVSSRDEEIIITRNGKPVAIIVSPDEFDSWKETLANRADAELMAEIRHGLADIRKKRQLYTLKALFTE